jgi:hypothetical protein
MIFAVYLVEQVKPENVFAYRDLIAVLSSSSRTRSPFSSVPTREPRSLRI